MARALRPGGAFSSPRRRPPASATLCGRRVCLSSGAGRPPLLCGEGGSHTRAALGRLLPNVPVGLELGSPTPVPLGAGQVTKKNWAGRILRDGPVRRLGVGRLGWWGLGVTWGGYAVAQGKSLT